MGRQQTNFVNYFLAALFGGGRVLKGKQRGY